MEPNVTSHDYIPHPNFINPNFINSPRSPPYSPMSTPYSPRSPDSRSFPRSPRSPRYSPGSQDNRWEPYYPEYRRASSVYVREDEDVEGNQHMAFLNTTDVLDCPICIHPLTIPVFQCQNGHIACSSCSTKIGNKCPSCSSPFGHIRCRAIENVIEVVQVSCPNFKYGCTEKTNYSDKTEHENTCAFSPCSCPMVSCTFIGSLMQLAEHFTSTHPHIATSFGYENSFSIVLEANQKNTLLQEKDGQLFSLNRKEFENLGSSINISCILPSTCILKFPYKLVAYKDDCAVKLNSVADNVANLLENPDQRSFLMVPQDFVDSRGDLKVQILISNPIPIA